MNNQPNDMVTLEWLLPLFNQQLAQVSDGWQAETTLNFEQIAQYYHEISGALIIVKLSRLATIAAKLSMLAELDSVEALDAKQRRIGQFAHQLLQHELTQYAQTGNYHQALLNKTINELTQALPQNSTAIDSGDTTADSRVKFEPSGFSETSNSDIESVQSIAVAVPELSMLDTAALTPMQPEQYKQLLLVWRQQSQQLLRANSNQPSNLANLEKVSRYLWQSTASHPISHIEAQQRLWYLAALWLNNLAANSLPLPALYAPLLAQLDCILNSRYQQTLHLSDQSAGSSTNHSPISTDEYITHNMIEDLIADLYIQLNSLAVINEQTQNVLGYTAQTTAFNLRFLPRILDELETIIFGFDKPQTLISPLQHLKRQFARRGWMDYEWQVSQILTALENNMASESDFAQIQGQIGRQLQELYSAIHEMEQSIRNKIGKAASFLTLQLPADSIATEQQALTFIESTDDELRQLRIAVEDIKDNFNNYIQRQQTYLLPTSEAFIEIGNAFDDMGLSSIRGVSDKLGELFIKLETYKIKNVGWKLTQALADGLTSIELLLDYLAQQVFDQRLLQQAFEYVEKADKLLAALIAAPDEVTAYVPLEQTLFNVTRYDDSGEIAPDDEAVESQELQAARAQTQPDNFDMDEEIREIFIEEAEEVLANLADFLPIWQQDMQDLSPLTEVRRGFHTLKGSGRMVGAFSVSEMAWAIEKLLNRILDNSLPVTEETVELVLQTTASLPVLVADFTALQAPSIDPAITILQSTNLLAGQPLSQGMDASTIAESSLATDATELQSQVSDLEQTTDISLAMVSVDSSDNNNSNIDNNTDSPILDSSTTANTVDIPIILEPFMEQAAQLPSDDQDSDPDIKEIFIEEAEEVLADITPRYEQWRRAPSDLAGLTEIRRGFHTLKGSGRMVGAYYSAELAWAIEDMLNRILDHHIVASDDITQLIADVLAAYPSLIETFANNNEDDNQAYPAIIPLWVACAQAYSKQHGDKFSYGALRQGWLTTNNESFVSATDSSADSSADNYADNYTNDYNSVDTTLESMHSVNEMMIDAPIVTILQTEDEQAFGKIFIEEARALLQDISDFVTTHHQENVEVTDEIVRAFHTLRAASGSSALSAISDVSATIEHSLEQLQTHDTPMSAQHLQAMAQSITLIENYLNAYEQSQEQQDLSAESLQNEQDLISLQALLGKPDELSELTHDKLSVAHLLNIDIDGLLNAEMKLDAALNADSIEQIEAYVRQQMAQIERLASNTEDSPKFTILLKALGSVYRHLDSNPSAARNAQIQSALLAGHQQLVGLFDALAGSMSLKVDLQVLEELRAVIATKTASSVDGHIDNQVDDVDERSDSLNDEDETAAIETTESALMVQSKPADKVQLEAIDTDIELLEIFLEEAQELDSSIAQSFSKWQADTNNKSTLKVLQRHLHTIKGGARMAGIRSIGDLTHEAESIYEAFVEERLYPTEQWLAIMQMVQDTLSLQIDHVVHHQEAFFAHKLIEQLQQFARSDQLPAAITLILPRPQNLKSNDLDDVDTIDAGHKAAKQASGSASLDSIIAESWTDGLPDPDILEVFLEEADEIVVSSNEYLQLFLSDVSDVSTLQALQRDLHTMKGGARMVSANGIADLAHEMETVYEELAIDRRPTTEMIAQLLTACHDWLADAVFILKQQVNPPTPKELILALQRFSKHPDDLKHIPNESLQAHRVMISAAKAQNKTAHVIDNLNEMPSMAGSFAEQEQSSSSNEMIRISGGVIEHMINLSGESAINRARIDMGMSSLTNSIEEMGTTVQRLADQLRRMEIELEAQILSQIDDAELINNEDFDPLEMDQYSSLNQLSKSLTESASDLIDINSTLLEKTRDSEGLLLQLSRTQTELQDGLMNSRMVPFTHLTPRLERIVRQTASELNKSVELNIINADNEIDRTILDRITSPLEHMLRNAVDHGIENTQARLIAGKDRSGHVTLEVLREGSEVVVHLTDDGHGINVEAVREKAIAQGLIAADEDTLTDLDIMQYIFNAGLTTTKKVTQISGRGVGMDVVISEIRQLGGMVSVTSKQGRGSRFTIRVPLTVAVSDALVVRAADRYYAIPLVQIERVIRINPEKLYDYYESGATTLRIEDDDYRIRYLNGILSGSKLNELMVSTNTTLPLIIVKNRAGQKLALQVDQIAGSRIEVVVKPLGRQLSHLAGISAATIMGDGSVMLILDLIALMRNAPLQNIVKSVSVEPSQIEEQITVLVVDDSVTVRKVTSRLLERQGINVVIAKDGIDAIEILQETIPDLMLLDIEMPRMDGFEVATQVRHSTRLQNIPIIMITSRTGEKHRQRALEIGVNDYMGKPFQESELLNKMQALLGKKISLSHDG